MERCANIMIEFSSNNSISTLLKSSLQLGEESIANKFINTRDPFKSIRINLLQIILLRICFLLLNSP